jgi:lipoate-protein ligase B
MPAPGDALLLSLGQTGYARALELQRGLVRLRANDDIPDVLVLLEHPPVITMGKSAKATNLLLSEPELARRGIELFRVERGGDVTYHGPGQLVGYPVFHLKQGLIGVRPYVEKVEAALIHALARLGVAAAVRPGHIGVWVGDRKIASIGVAVSKWVTFHGFALNVTTDLSAFTLMNPCGMPDVVMTSVEREGGTSDPATVRRATVDAFQDQFGCRFGEWGEDYASHLPRSITDLTNGLSFSAIADASARE